jgi:L-aspartate oxidase
MNRIRTLNEEVADYYGHFRVTPDLVELRNLLQTAELIVRSALHRHESRGLHFTLDWPETLPTAVDTTLVP